MNQNSFSRRQLMQLLTTTMIGAAYASAPEVGRTVLNVKTEGPRPVFIPPGAGEKGKISESDIVFKLDGSQTAGNLGSSESILYPGQLGAPPHLHKNFDEICIVQEGTIHIMVGEDVQEVPAGGWHLRPRGIIHTFWNSGTAPAKFIELYTPAGHELYMKELAKMFEGNKRPNPGDLAGLAAKHDITFAFNKLQGIIDKYKVHL